MSRADDLVQDTLVRAIAKQRCWQWGTNLRAWLFTLMHHQNADIVRCSVRESSAVEFDGAWPIPRAPNRSGMAAVVARSRSRAHSNFRGAAPGNSFDRSRRLFVWRGRDHPRRTIGTIRSRLSRGRESLRTLMDWRDETEVEISAGNLGKREIRKKQIAISHDA
jgi:RNA polymerase sigma-70 factor, ECF subfamily